LQELFGASTNVGAFGGEGGILVRGLRKPNKINEIRLPQRAGLEKRPGRDRGKPVLPTGLLASVALRDHRLIEPDEPRALAPAEVRGARTSEFLDLP
jgi:hypothetical protein